MRETHVATSTPLRKKLSATAMRALPGGGDHSRLREVADSCSSSADIKIVGDFKLLVRCLRLVAPPRPIPSLDVRLNEARLASPLCGHRLVEIQPIGADLIPIVH